MDLLKSEQNSNTKSFIDIILDNGMFPLITRPTRITKSSATLIDNLLVSWELYYNSLSGIIINDMSDHMPCISVFPNAISQKGKTITIQSRDMKGDNINRLKSSLANIDWTFTLALPDVNQQFSRFHEILLNMIDDCCPSRTLEISNKKLIRELWITKGILRSLNKQKQLYKEHLKTKQDDTEKRYKTYRSTL